MASPTLVLAELKADGRDLLVEFRSLAPERKPIGVQRWSVRRVALIAGIVLVLALAIAVILNNWRALL